MKFNLRALTKIFWITLVVVAIGAAIVWGRRSFFPKRTLEERLVSPTSEDTEVLLATFKLQEDPTLLARVAKALVATNSQSEQVTVVLVAKLDTQEKEVQAAVRSAIQSIGHPILLEHLKSNQLRTRMAAAQALVVVGPDANLGLIEAAKSEKRSIRFLAIWALGKIGAGSDAVVKQLVASLKDKDADVRREAATAIGRFGSRAVVAVPTLMKRIEDPEIDVRLASIDALGEIGPLAKKAVPELIHALCDKGRTVRLKTVQALGKIGPGAAAAVPDLVFSFRRYAKDSVYQKETARALGTMGKQASKFWIKALQDKDEKLRTSSALVLGEIGNAALPALPALVNALGDSNEQVRLYAATALTKLGNPALKALRKALRAEDKQVRQNVIKALAGFGAKAVPAIVEGLKDAEPKVREVAVMSLGKLGDKATSSVPKLAEALFDDEETVRLAVAQGLRSMGKSAAPVVPKLVERLSSEKSNKVSLAIIEALGAVGPSASSAIPSLTPFLEKKNAELRLATVETFGKFGDKAKSALPVLFKLFEEKNDKLATTAALTVSRIGKEAKKSLLGLVTHEKSQVRGLAVFSLGNLELDVKGILPVLVKALNDPEDGVKIRALVAIARYGPAAKSAAEKVEALRSDTHKAVREQAAQTLKTITKESDGSEESEIPEKPSTDKMPVGT